jgi:hypothetical protein
VAAVSVSRPDPDALEFATEVAVTVTLGGLLRATVGAVYSPVASIVPPFGVVTAQVTDVFVAFATVAVNFAVCSGQPLLFGNRLAGVPELTLTDTGGALLPPPPPQATRTPKSARETQRPLTTEHLDTLRPARPKTAIPASGNASGNHGARPFAACRRAAPAGGLGPVVTMLT